MCTLDASRVRCWVGRSVACVQLCVGSWGLAVGDVLFLESGHQGRCSQGLREGGMDGGGPVRGDTRGAVRGCICAHVREPARCVSTCVLCVSVLVGNLGCRDVMRLCLCACAVSVYCAPVLPPLCACVCVDFEPSGRPSLPRPPIQGAQVPVLGCPRAGGAELQPEPLPTRPLIEARFMWATPPPLATSL